VKNNTPPAAGRGRPKGSPNKIQAAVKELVIQALDQAGGVDYLVTQSRDNPTAFMTLVGKVLPLQTEHSGAIGIGRIVYPGLDD
jgi:hypothetical protein